MKVMSILHANKYSSNTGISAGRSVNITWISQQLSLLLRPSHFGRCRLMSVLNLPAGDEPSVSELAYRHR